MKPALKDSSIAKKARLSTPNNKLPSLKRANTPLIRSRNSLTSLKPKKIKPQGSVMINSKARTQPLPTPNTSLIDEPVSKAPIRKKFIISEVIKTSEKPYRNLNYDSVLQLETSLWRILESLQRGVTDISKICDNYWDTFKRSNIWEVETLFKDKKIRKSIRKALILELCGVALASHYSQYTWKTLANIRNLFLFVHQNLLSIFEILLKKSHDFPAEVIKAFNNAILARKVTKAGVLLLQNSESIQSLLKVILKHFKQHSMHTAISVSISGILQSIDKMNFITIYDALSQARRLEVPEDVPEALPPVFPPFLPPPPPGKLMYTLVLDLDETLVHYYETNNEGRVLVRPGCEEFLKGVSEWYEVVIFTAGLQDYADWVIDQIDPHKYVNHRLYRQHAMAHGQSFVKDLDKLGRDISRVIIVDNVAENFQLHPKNGIFIKSWFDDISDTALYELLPVLTQVSKKCVKDVREALRELKEQMIREIMKGNPNPHLNLNL
ncbi:unnamed protein product [Blepharisma stoltei]|uniref:FCP1 homology domain-containing protein n=1 Tax=Blepharisma stoltei TaxID=1481888 RepID=A0AAU9KGS3_9CILI|nr:unnamed protein product [Blepharisma stoltei]